MFWKRHRTFLLINVPYNPSQVNFALKIVDGDPLCVIYTRPFQLCHCASTRKRRGNINSHQVEVPAHVAYELCIMACRSETFPKYISIIPGTLFALRITTNICPSDNIFLCCLLGFSAVVLSSFLWFYLFVTLACGPCENEVRAKI